MRDHIAAHFDAHLTQCSHRQVNRRDLALGVAGTPAENRAVFYLRVEWIYLGRPGWDDIHMRIED